MCVLQLLSLQVEPSFPAADAESGPAAGVGPFWASLVAWPARDQSRFAIDSGDQPADAADRVQADRHQQGQRSVRPLCRHFLPSHRQSKIGIPFRRIRCQELSDLDRHWHSEECSGLKHFASHNWEAIAGDSAVHWWAQQADKVLGTLRRNQCPQG